MSDSKFTPLPQGAGYGVVVGLGIAFALALMGVTFVLKRYNREIMTAEEFSTAGRSVKKHLISACVVSSWTWSATLLTSTTQTYSNGVFGAYSYAAGATCQIVLFSCLAMRAKAKAPTAHTYLEIIKARYGSWAHITFCTWGLITNILVTAMLLTGTSAVVNDLTGMNVVAAVLLLPLGVMVYTLFGGLKATFISDYTHGVVVIVILLVFAFTTWTTHDVLGLPGAVWDILQDVAAAKPREGNAEGSYLTMRSHHGGVFFVINIVGNFGTVFLDNGYFNKAFASLPTAAMPGYVLGGLAWFAVPMFTATTMGLAGLCLENTPQWPTYPRALTDYEVLAGLVLPNSAYALLGRGGAVASLLLVFFAAASAMSSELIAVSSILTYDIYREYFNPKASGKALMTVSHMSVVGFSYIMAGFAIGLYYAGVSMGYLYELMGIIIGGAVLPSTMTLLSSKQNKYAASLTPPIATGLAIMSWLVCTRSKVGPINVTTTFDDIPMLTGNVVALLTPLVTIPVLTFVFKPQNFDWEALKTIALVDEDEELAEAEGVHYDSEKMSHEDSPHGSNEPSPQNQHPAVSLRLHTSQVAQEIANINERFFNDENEKVNKNFKFAVIMCLFLTFSLLVLWPMPMYGSGYIFSKPFFRGWIVVLFIWIFISSYIVIIGPIIESRSSIFNTLRGIYWDLTGQSWKVREWQQSNPEQLHAVNSQVTSQLLRREKTEVVEGVTQEREEREEIEEKK